MAHYHVNTYAFPLSTAFVDKFMLSAQPAYVMVYIYGLRLCYAQNQGSNANIAEALGLLESDVVKAWKYWEEQGVVRLGEKEEGAGIEFLDLTAESAPPSHTAISTKPSYNASEVAGLIKSNNSVRNLLTLSEKILGKPLSPSETVALYSLYDWLGMPIEVILMLLEHCASLDKRSMRYIEKTAMGWNEAGIDTPEKAQHYLKECDRRSRLGRKYKRMFGIDHQLTNAEYQTILDWIDNLGMSDALIKKAMEKTVANVGRVAFSYMNAIIQDWYKNGVKTPEDIEKKDAAPGRARKKTRGSAPSNYDMDELDRLTLEYRNNS